jgi:hypothetical protein
MTDIVERLYKIIDTQLGLTRRLTIEAANEIERLRKKCDDQAMILRRLTPDKFPDTLFIHGEVGKKDSNGMPEKLLVVPAYGVDFSYVYERTEKTIGPEW